MSEQKLPVIAHVLHRLAFAGAEVLAGALGRQLRGRYRTVYFCLDGVGDLGEELASEGFTVVTLGRQPGVDWKVAKRIRHAAREHQVDLLHAHQYTPFFYGSVSRGWRSRPRLLFTEHGRHYPDVRKLKRVIANQLLFRPTDRATAVGQFVADALVKNEGIPARRIKVIYNGINPEKFVRPTSTRPAIRSELGLTPDQPVVLQVARFHSVKDHATAIKAMAKVIEQRPDAVLLLAGDGNEQSAMKQLAKELGIAPQVRFLGVRTDIAELVAGADVFVLSSLSEGVSVTLLEAMAGGCPICATEVGGNAEVVLHEQTGLLSPRQDAEALGANLRSLLASDDLRKRYALAGQARVNQDFTQDRMHKAFSDVYDQMLSIE